MLMLIEIYITVNFNFLVLLRPSLEFVGSFISDFRLDVTTELDIKLYKNTTPRLLWRCLKCWTHKIYEIGLILFSRQFIALHVCSVLCQSHIFNQFSANLRNDDSVIGCCLCMNCSSYLALSCSRLKVYFISKLYW